MSNTAYMCKDCCEVHSEKGPYENCVNCGSHRIVEIEAYMLAGELYISGDTLFETAKFSFELDKIGYMDELLYQKTMGE